MPHVQIQTAQHVAIEYKVASISDRILAALIDLLLMFSYLFGTFMLIGIFPYDPSWGVLTIIITPVFFYHLACEVFMDGQSFGKKLRQIKVVKLDGSQPGLGSYLLRWILRLIDVQLLSGAIAILVIVLNGKGQRLGDIAAGTCVVQLHRPTALSETVYSAVDDSYQPRYPQVERLSDEDIATIKAVIKANLGSRRSPSILHMTRKAQATVAAKMDIVPDVPPLPFLRTVVKDYNALMGHVE